MKGFTICKKREDILSSIGHLLIEGGPGAGKTTIALLKAKSLINFLQAGQKVLFLSFARATISRIEEQAKNLITNDDKKLLEINTYHGFTWSIIQSHGYLLNSHRYLKLITPPTLSALIAEIPENERDSFKETLLIKDGVICFDLFAKIAADIFKRADKICSTFSKAYPFILVDEFQDTDKYEWELIQLLGKGSTIIALADLNQRIFEFRGASITRIPEFNQVFKVKRFDLGIENNRSGNTDIVKFGDDLLQGANIGKAYKNVIVSKYPYYRDQKSPLKYALLNSIKRVKKCSTSGDWSIAILVKSKLETLSVSSYLTTQNISHEVLIDPAGPALAASIIAKTLEPGLETEEGEKQLLRQLISHIKGRKGEKIPQKDLELTKALEIYLETQKITGAKRKLLISDIKELLVKRLTLPLIGVPGEDWIAVRKLFQEAKHEVLLNVYEDARFLRLLNKGAVLNERLSEIWRQNGNYSLASNAVDSALLQEHFSMSRRSWNGVFVMNMHKSKGKEFDEVIIWEELYKQIVPANANASRLQQDRLIMRVAITRAKAQTTILTPAKSPCILL